MFIPHLDLTPVFYGFVIFLGLLSMWRKLISLMLIELAIEAAVFYLVFTLHGGSMAGGFAATIAALLAGAVFPRMLRS